MNLSWGKPIVELAKITNGVIGEYVASPTPTQDSAKLTPTAGDKQEAAVEGGELEDVKQGKNKYVFEMDIRKSKGKLMPIEHADGVVLQEYAMRLTPEDPSVMGFQIPRCTVHVEESWNAKDGEVWKYSLDALIPLDGGKKLREYDGSQTAKVVLEGKNYMMTAAVTAINANGGKLDSTSTAEMIQAAFAALAADKQTAVITALGAGS